MIKELRKIVKDSYKGNDGNLLNVLSDIKGEYLQHRREQPLRGHIQRRAKKLSSDVFWESLLGGLYDLRWMYETRNKMYQTLRIAEEFNKTSPRPIDTERLEKATAYLEFNIDQQDPYAELYPAYQQETKELPKGITHLALEAPS